MADEFQDGDVGFYGVDLLRPADDLGPGLVAGARNCRFRNGTAKTRGGRYLAPWLNRNLSGSVAPWAEPVQGWAAFRNPNGLEYVYLATGGSIYRCREGQEPLTEALPSGDAVNGPVTFLQAFNRLLVWRGRFLPPLALDEVGGGFAYLIPERGAIAAFTADQLFRDGPWTAPSSITGDAATSTATVTTASDHGFATGMLIRVRHSEDTEYNTLAAITVTSPNTFTYRTAATIADTSADGTMTYAPQEDFWVTDATIVEKAVTSITRASQTATLTATAAHGLSTGQYVVIRGANQDEYNGVFQVTVTAADTFTYTVVNSPASPATGTITFTKVARTYTGMPNGYNAAFVGNRVLLPTSYIPGASSSVAGSYTAKRDYVAPSDILDPQRFSVSNEFRINQGSDDELQALVKLGSASVVCLKDRSVHLLDGVSGDLSNATGQVLIQNYGAVNPHAWALVGKDLVFVSPRRGVVSLRQSVAGEIQGVDVPLSAPIDPLIQRINWTLADLIRVAYCDNRLYVAVPLDEGEAYGRPMLFPEIQYDQLDGDGNGWIPLDNDYLTLGATYEWTPDPDGVESLYTGASYTTSTYRFTWGGETMWVKLPSSLPLGVQSQLRQVRSGVNNAILVFDYAAEATEGDAPNWRGAHPAGQWLGYDTGDDLSVREFLVANYDGRQRLLLSTEDGSVTIYEELEFEDVLPAPPGYDATVQYVPVDSEMTSRAYRFNQPGEVRATTIEVVLGTFAPRYTVTAATEGVAESATVADEVEKDRTLYYRPAWKAPYDDTNANADSEAPYRRDYSVDLLDAGSLLVTDTGVSLFNVQETVERWAPPALAGRTSQLTIGNDRGYLEVRGIRNTAVRGTERKGVLA